MKTALNGPGTADRRLVANLAYHFTLVVSGGALLYKSGGGGGGKERV